MTTSPLSAVSSIARDDAVAAVVATIRGGQMTPLHLHRDDEVLRVLEGAAVLHAGGGETTLGPGDEAIVAAGAPHAFAGVAPETRYVAVTRTPSAERYAGFLRAVALPDPMPVPEDEEDGVVAADAGASGITVLGPPGTLAPG